jgi:hypothetical protein
MRIKIDCTLDLDVPEDASMVSINSIGDIFCIDRDGEYVEGLEVNDEFSFDIEKEYQNKIHDLVYRNQKIWGFRDDRYTLCWKLLKYCIGENLFSETVIYKMINHWIGNKDSEQCNRMEMAGLLLDIINGKKEGNIDLASMVYAAMCIQVKDVTMLAPTVRSNFCWISKACASVDVYNFLLELEGEM